ncbi:MAG: LuxR family transcriptional regulator [Nocardioidaceae bacterium]
MTTAAEEPTARRTEVTTLSEIADDLLAEAGRQRSGRAAKTLVVGTSMRATLIALTTGTELSDHDSPTSAMLQCLTGRVRLHTMDREWVVEGGQVVSIPHRRHGLHADVDSVVLLTVALR